MHDSLVAYALSLAGLSYGKSPDRYTRELYPYDNPQQAKQMASSQSSCGLVCEAILRACGIDGRITWRGSPINGLKVPYGGRYRRLPAVAYQVELARQRRQWVSSSGLRKEPLASPDVGDMVLIGHGGAPDWGGTEHVLTVTGLTGEHIESIDGGQVDPANEGRTTAIRLVMRRLVRREAQGELWLVPPDTRLSPGGRPLGGKRVQGWIKAPLLPTQDAKNSFIV